ncbi:MAG: glycosyltransferase family 2 protein [archaeon]|nr:glycosyltransferase family 2 protein [archaeon]
MELVITIPAYNEEKSIGNVISEIPSKIKGVKKITVLVIDDGSTDQTVKVAREKKAVVISNKVNKGLAFSFKRGLETALSMGADIIVNTDADFQYNQKQIPLLVEPILSGEVDLVLGSRFKGSIEEMSLQKRIGNIIASKTLSWICMRKISDGQTGFRAFSREAAAKINLFSNYTYTQESILQAVDKGISIKEIPVDFRKRHGESRLISNIWVYAFNSIKMIFYYFLYYKPLNLFTALSAITLVIGSFFGVKVILHYLQTGLVSPYIPSAGIFAFSIILSAQLILFGLLSESQKVNRHVNEELLYLQKIKK